MCEINRINGKYTEFSSRFRHWKCNSRPAETTSMQMRKSHMQCVTVGRSEDDYKTQVLSDRQPIASYQAVTGQTSLSMQSNTDDTTFEQKRI